MRFVRAVDGPISALYSPRPESMQEERLRGHGLSEASNIHPYVLAALLCDSIITEAQTGKKTLIGIFENVFVRSFPVAHQLAIYLKITDAEGPYQFRVDYVDLGADQILDRQEIGELTIPSRLQTGDIVVNIAVPIPSPGSYEFRFYANGFYLSRVAFRAIPIADLTQTEG